MARPPISRALFVWKNVIGAATHLLAFEECRPDIQWDQHHLALR
jgi:hypothetical protein